MADITQIKAAFLETWRAHMQSVPAVFTKPFEEGAPPPYWEHAFSGGTAKAPHAPGIIVAEHSGTIAGYAAITSGKGSVAPKRGAEFRLDDIWVAPDRRGKGLGTRLITLATSFAQEAGATGLTAMIWGGNPAAIRAFETTEMSELYRAYRATF